MTVLRFPRKPFPTMAQKLETCRTHEERDEMVKCLAARDYALSDEERAAVARNKATIDRRGRA